MFFRARVFAIFPCHNVGLCPQSQRLRLGTRSLSPGLSGSLAGSLHVRVTATVA